MRAKIIAALFAALLFTPGCYTVLWTPDMELPKPDKEAAEDSFYGPVVIYEYYPYYHTPWWYGPGVSYSPGTIKKVIESTTNVIRENGGDRGTPSRDIPLPSPSRSQGSSSSQSTNSSGQSGSSDSSPRRSGDDNTNTVRGNDGGRSTDKGKR